jgi:hypothetical protein
MQPFAHSKDWEWLNGFTVLWRAGGWRARAVLFSRFLLFVNVFDCKRGTMLRWLFSAILTNLQQKMINFDQFAAKMINFDQYAAKNEQFWPIWSIKEQFWPICSKKWAILTNLQHKRAILTNMRQKLSIFVKKQMSFYEDTAANIFADF